MDDSDQSKQPAYQCRHLEILLDAYLDPGPPLSKCGLLLGLLLIHLRVPTNGLNFGSDHKSKPDLFHQICSVERTRQRRQYPQAHRNQHYMICSASHSIGFLLSSSFKYFHSRFLTTVALLHLFQHFSLCAPNKSNPGQKEWALGRVRGRAAVEHKIAEPFAFRSPKTEDQPQRGELYRTDTRAEAETHLSLPLFLLLIHLVHTLLHLELLVF